MSEIGMAEDKTTEEVELDGKPQISRRAALARLGLTAATV
tara:strand:+ start:36688 stop:36807 length:120 start_codon:yes stop_codon:yes gene_type:complete